MTVKLDTSNLKEKYGEINYDNETDKFINYHLAKGSVFVDAESR